MREGYHYSTDQYVDRCQDIIDLIERERPQIKKQFPNQQDAGMDY